MRKCTVLFLLLITVICIFKLQDENTSEDINNPQIQELATNGKTTGAIKK